MEKRIEYLFYIGIQEKDGEIQSGEPVASRVVLPFAGGKLVVCSCLVSKALFSPCKKLFRWQRKQDKKKQQKKLMEQIREVKNRQKTIDYFWTEGEVGAWLWEERGFEAVYDEETFLDRLYEVYLYQQGKINPTDKISLSLPPDCGQLTMERLQNILKPYLPGLNTVLFVGAEEAVSRMLEEYLYDEYGIVMSYGKIPLRNTLWIDLEDTGGLNLSKYAKENGICHINRAEVLKFLDTAVKNGYNTKVN